MRIRKKKQDHSQKPKRGFFVVFSCRKKLPKSGCNTGYIQLLLLTRFVDDRRSVGEPLDHFGSHLLFAQRNGYAKFPASNDLRKLHIGRRERRRIDCDWRLPSGMTYLHYGKRPVHLCSACEPCELLAPCRAIRFLSNHYVARCVQVFLKQIMI